jgi:hypothetical protein
MDINTIILIVIVLTIVYAMLNNGNKKKLLAEKERDISLNEKDELSEEDVATYGQVQERKKQLFSVIDDNLNDHPDESAQLKDIIEDWANLKIEAFQNRRSWVRATPDK